jgi:hypothetical protein
MNKTRILSSVLFFILCFSLLLSPIHSKGFTFIVNNTADTGPGSLRGAITAANGIGGADTIVFNILAVGVQTISPDSQLPKLTDTAGVLIDGLTQGVAASGANPPATLNLMIEISGLNADTASGIFIDSDNNIIRGLIINDFAYDGISIEAGPLQNTSNNEIYWNIIGMDNTGTVLKGNCDSTGLWAGVRIYNVPGEEGRSIATNNFIAENLISGNAPFGDGVQIMGPQVPGDVFGNIVLRNYIGTDIAGMFDMGNAHEGVCLCEGTHDNIVNNNLISGNDYDGVGIQGYNNVSYPALPILTQFNMIGENIIGLAIDTVTSVPNSCHGVAVGEYGFKQWGCARNNFVFNNIIAYNGWDGVSVWEDAVDGYNADENLISGNSIFNNDSLGIDLQNNGVTPNDPGDIDTLANQELNFPVIDSAVYLAGNTIIYGSININGNPLLATIEIFKANPDPTGYGEGETFLGSTKPDGVGNWIDTVSGLNVGDSVTATTIDVAYNTSEFSLNCEVKASSGIEEDASTTSELLKVSSPILMNSLEISFAVKKKGKVKVGIYDITGKLVKNLIDKECEPSSYSVSWNGKNAKGEELPAGVYICKLESGDAKAATKIIKIIK